MNTILFDLDGTLLPMDDQLFMKNYITQLLGLVRRSPFNMEISRFTQALEYATGACLNNDGAMTNFERFFTAFQDKFGPIMAYWIPFSWATLPAAFIFLRILFARTHMRKNVWNWPRKRAIQSFSHKPVFAPGCHLLKNVCCRA